MRNPLAKLTAKEEDERRSHERSHVPRVLLNIFAIGMVAVIAGGVLAPKFHVAVALLWGFGFCVSGMLMGFLFAIPRVLPANAVAASTRSDTASASAGESSARNDTVTRYSG